MSKLLLDANLSPKTAAYLRDHVGLDVVSLQARRLGHLPDREVVALARREGRVIVTFDQDYGEIYSRRLPGQIGVVYLQLRDQYSGVVSRVLERFFRTQANSIDLDHSLVVITEQTVRIIRR